MPVAQVVLGESMIPVGRLVFETDGRRAHSSFRYDDRWLANEISFDLAPSLPRGRSDFHASAGGRESRKRDVIAGPFADGSPDSWGRKLLRRFSGKGRASSIFWWVPTITRARARCAIWTRTANRFRRRMRRCPG